MFPPHTTHTPHPTKRQESQASTDISSSPQHVTFSSCVWAERMAVESSEIASNTQQQPGPTTIQSRRGMEQGASPTSPPAPKLWSWSTNGQKVVVRGGASSKVAGAPAEESGVELRDVEIGTAPSSPARLKVEPPRLQSVEEVSTVKPQEKASCLGRGLLMYSGRWQQPHAK